MLISDTTPCSDAGPGLPSTICAGSMHSLIPHFMTTSAGHGPYASSYTVRLTSTALLYRLAVGCPTLDTDPDQIRHGFRCQAQMPTVVFACHTLISYARRIASGGGGHEPIMDVIIKLPVLFECDRTSIRMYQVRPHSGTLPPRHVQRTYGTHDTHSYRP
jgi:hypothetical protein